MFKKFLLKFIGFCLIWNQICFYVITSFSILSICHFLLFASLLYPNQMGSLEASCCTLLKYCTFIKVYPVTKKDKKPQNNLLYQLFVHMIGCNINCGILCLVNEFRNYHHRTLNPVLESWVENPVQGYKGLNSHVPKVRDSIYSYTLNFLLDSQIC